MDALQSPHRHLSAATSSQLVKACEALARSTLHYLWNFPLVIPISGIYMSQRRREHRLIWRQHFSQSQCRKLAGNESKACVLALAGGKISEFLHHRQKVGVRADSAHLHRHGNANGTGVCQSWLVSLFVFETNFFCVIQPSLEHAVLLPQPPEI